MLWMHNLFAHVTAVCSMAQQVVSWLHAVSCDAHARTQASMTSTAHTSSAGRAQQRQQPQTMQPGAMLRSSNHPSADNALVAETGQRCQGKQIVHPGVAFGSASPNKTVRHSAKDCSQWSNDIAASTQIEPCSANIQGLPVSQTIHDARSHNQLQLQCSQKASSSYIPLKNANIVCNHEKYATNRPTASIWQLSSTAFMPHGLTDAWQV